MKRINIYFEDKEFETLTKAKGEYTWHDFVLQLVTLQDTKTKEKEVIT